MSLCRGVSEEAELSASTVGVIRQKRSHPGPPSGVALRRVCDAHGAFRTAWDRFGSRIRAGLRGIRARLFFAGPQSARPWAASRSPSPQLAASHRAEPFLPRPSWYRLGASQGIVLPVFIICALLLLRYQCLLLYSRSRYLYYCTPSRGRAASRLVALLVVGARALVFPGLSQNFRMVLVGNVCAHCSSSLPG